MSGCSVVISAGLACHVSRVSPTIHRVGVKREIARRGPYIKENNNSLSSLHPFTPAPSRDARPRDFACVREGAGER